MNDKNTEKLNGVIDMALSEIGDMSLDSESFKCTVEGIEKLCKVSIDAQKAAGELEEKRKARESEEKLREQELREQKVKRWIDCAINVCTSGATLGFFAFITLISMDLDANGMRSPTTNMLVNLISKIPKIK